MLFTVKIRSSVDPREHARSIEASSSSAALKLALIDFERLYPACDVRQISVSVMKEKNQ